MDMPNGYSLAEAVTKSDSANIAQIKTRGLPRALYVGGAGIVVAVLEDDSTQQFTCIAGQILPVRMKRVNSGTTTATLMIALW